MKQRSFNPFYTYSLYVDTQDYLADSIISDTGLKIIPLKETKVYTKSGKEYVLVYVKYRRKESEKHFKEFLDVLKYNMYFFNIKSYVEDCDEIYGGLNSDEIFGENWS